MCSLRDRAEVIAIGIELGVLPRADAATWAESVLADCGPADQGLEAIAHAALFEVIAMGEAYENDVANALRHAAQCVVGHPSELDAAWVEAEVVQMLTGVLAWGVPQRSGRFARGVQGRPMRADPIPGQSALLKFSEDPTRASVIATALYRLAVDDALSDRELTDFAFWLEDSLCLVDAGMIAESRAELVEALRGALELAVARLPLEERRSGDGSAGQ